MPKDVDNERLLARNKILLDKNVFVNGTFVPEPEEDIADVRNFEIEELIGIKLECLYKLNILDKKSADNLVTELYEKSAFLQDILTCLMDPNRYT